MVASAALALVCAGVGGVLAQPASAADPAPLPWIGTSGTGPDRELVDSSTQRRFVPRGSNYVRLAKLREHEAWFHSTFEPGLYDAARASEALGAMRDDG